MPNICINYEKKCGGCPLLALPYREQLAQKQARLQELRSTVWRKRPVPRSSS